VPGGINKIALRVGVTPEEAAVDMVSGDFFSGLGVRALCGRTLDLADEKDHAGVAVLGYGFWSRRFGQNCSTIGKTLFVKGVPFTIVDVAAKNFFGVESNSTDVRIPLQKRPELNAWGAEGDLAEASLGSAISRKTANAKARRTRETGESSGESA
jgi:MacB-like periplasmic core domain